jgi:predicted nucleic acid-binding protein
VAQLIDTNILVYRFDPRFPAKQEIASQVLREGMRSGSIRVPHQALVEFVSVVTCVQAGGRPLLSRAEALRECEEFLAEFTVLYPVEALFRTALRGAAAYNLSWFDAHIWAYAEHFGLSEIVSEDFEDGRIYGSARILNPFAELA